MNWLDQTIAEYYEEFCKARDAHYRKLTSQQKDSLVNAFQSAAAHSDKKEKVKADKDSSKNKIHLREIHVEEGSTPIIESNLDQSCDADCWVNIHQHRNFN